MYYSNDLVINCVNLSLAIKTTFFQIFNSLFLISRILGNLIHNLENAITAFSDLSDFLTMPQPVENNYANNSYLGGYAAGKVLYFIFIDTTFDPTTN